MNTITIKNIGPVKDVTLNLNKVNVIMGPQSSGKSTIAKIISFCTWLNKVHSIRPFWLLKNQNIRLLESLKRYHRLGDEYFSDDSSIDYDGTAISFKYNVNGDKNVSVGLKDNRENRNRKVIYIPAERNFVSVIQNLRSYTEDNDNIQDFIKNWYEVKRKYNKSHSLKILNLGVKFYNVENLDIDRLTLEDGKDIRLQIASSGLQSVVPLVTLFDYVARGIFKESRPMSVEETDQLVRQINNMIKQRVASNNITSKNVDSENLAMLYDLLISKNYSSSTLIIEEPEQNLFPVTQKDLIYYMLQTINETDKDHCLIMTTHSPYILYAINNCMMGALVKDKIPEDKQNQFSNQSSWIDPKLVSLWEINEGKINGIQGKDGLIGDNYFDASMKKVMDDFYSLLNYYGQ